jgi:hypothetical protein
MTVQINREGRALFAALGAVMIVVGGLVAAINSAAPFDHGSWLAAYLVLVAGVSQIALGLGHLLLPVRPPSARLLRVQLACWNAGTLVVAGVGGLVDALDPGGHGKREGISRRRIFPGRLWKVVRDRRGCTDHPPASRTTPFR